MEIADIRPAAGDDTEAVRTLRGLLGDATASFDVDPLCDFVAERAGDVVGWIQVTFHEELPEIAERGAWIQSVAVLPQFRARGIGEELVRRAQAQATHAGDHVIACQPLDQDSATFFKGLGFADNTVQDREAFWSKRLA